MTVTAGVLSSSRAAGIGAAAVSAGLSSGCARQNITWKGPTESLDVLCPQIATHKYIITQMLVTADGKYLIKKLDRRGLHIMDKATGEDPIMEYIRKKHVDEHAVIA